MPWKWPKHPKPEHLGNGKIFHPLRTGRRNLQQHPGKHTGAGAVAHCSFRGYRSRRQLPGYKVFELGFQAPQEVVKSPPESGGTFLKQNLGRRE